MKTNSTRPTTESAGLFLDGIELDPVKVIDAVRRCVEVGMLVNKYRRMNSRALLLDAPTSILLDNIENVLGGGSIAEIDSNG